MRRKAAGENGMAISRALGVSKQYVYAIIKEVEQKGEEEVVHRRRRGRTKDVPLTKANRRALIDYILERTDADGVPDPEMTEAVVRHWFVETYNRPLTVHQLRRVLTEERLKIVNAADEFREKNASGTAKKRAAANQQAGETPKTGRKRGRPRKNQVMVDPLRSGVLGEQELEAMEASNRETLKKVSHEAPQPFRNPFEKLGRNDPCPYEPGKKFKNCCGAEAARWCLRLAEEQSK